MTTIDGNSDNRGPRDRARAAALVREFAANVVFYPKFETALSLIDDFVAYGVVNDQAPCMLVTGPTGVGKTELVRQHLRQHPPSTDGETDEVPAVFLETPAEVTLKSLAEALLVELGDPAPHRGGQVEKTRRVKDYIKELRVRRIVFDEVQHLTARRTDRGLLAAANWLKHLLNEGCCPILLVGTEEARELLIREPQLARRCFADHPLKPFGLESEEERNNFLALVAIMDDLLPMPERGTLLGAEMGVRLHVATLGRFGRLTLLAQKALFKGLMEGSAAVQERHLHAAYDEWAVLHDRPRPDGSRPPIAPNPFRKEAA